MNFAKIILLAGFACVWPLLLSACRNGADLAAQEPFPAKSPLVVSSAPLASISYLADYAQDGALPFTCEVLMRSDGMIRRNYAWKDETGADKNVSVVIRGDKAVRIDENGKTADADGPSSEMARFFAGLVLSPDMVLSAVRSDPDQAGGVVHQVRLEGVSGVQSCIVNTDAGSRLWTGFQVRMTAGNEISTSFPEYLNVSGVTFPARLVSSTGEGAPVRCTFRDVKINPELSEELFAFPGSNS